MSGTGLVAGAASGGIGLIDPRESQIIELLGKIHAQLIAGNRYTEAQRTRTMRTLNLSGGVRVSLQAPLRAEYIAFSGGTVGDIVGLQVGTAVILDWEIGSTDLKEIDTPYLLASDVQLVMVSGTDTVFRAWLHGHFDEGPLGVDR